MQVGLQGLCRFHSKQQCHCSTNLGISPPRGVGLLLCLFTPLSRITPAELGQGTDTWPQSSPEFIQGLGEELLPQTHVGEPGSGSKSLRLSRAVSVPVPKPGEEAPLLGPVCCFPECQLGTALARRGLSNPSPAALASQDVLLPAGPVFW